MSMKNSNDNIGNRPRDHPIYIAVPQPLRHRVPSFLLAVKNCGYIAVIQNNLQKKLIMLQVFSHYQSKF
jgi:hypothetical protein